MAELRTKETAESVTDFLNSIKDEGRRKDCFAVSKLMSELTKAEPKMWGSGIVGFGNTHLKYASGRELDWFYIGFSPRKKALTLYICGGIANAKNLLNKLGKHKTGVGCLYIDSLEDIDMKVLKELIQQGMGEMKKMLGK